MWVTGDKQNLPQVGKMLIFKLKYAKCFWANHRWANCNFPLFLLEKASS